LGQPRQFCREGDRFSEGAAGEGFSGVGIGEAIAQQGGLFGQRN